MKKLLVSDFDRTLYVSCTIPAENVEALIRWQNAGNLFAIATGRTEGILRILLKEYSVTPDFLICNNGANITAQDGTHIAKQYIDAQTVFPLAELLLKHYGAAVDVTLDTCRVQVEQEDHAMSPAISSDISEYMALDSFRADSRRVLQIHMRFPGPAQAQAAAEAVERQFPRISALPNEWNLDIVAHGVSKADGVHTLAQWKQFRGKIVAIGDSYNDLEMLRQYHGYTLDSANPEMKRQVPRICKSVAECIQIESDR